MFLISLGVGGGTCITNTVMNLCENVSFNFFFTYHRKNSFLGKSFKKQLIEKKWP